MAAAFGRLGGMQAVEYFSGTLMDHLFAICVQKHSGSGIEINNADIAFDYEHRAWHRIKNDAMIIQSK